MSEQRDRKPRSPLEVKTALQYFAHTNVQLGVICGSAMTYGAATNRTVIVVVASVLAALPTVSIIVLSVMDRDALRALMGDFGGPGETEPGPAADAKDERGTALDESPPSGMDEQPVSGAPR